MSMKSRRISPAFHLSKAQTNTMAETIQGYVNGCYEVGETRTLVL